MIYLSSITDFEQQVLNYFCPPPTKTVQKEADAVRSVWTSCLKHSVSTLPPAVHLEASQWACLSVPLKGRAVHFMWCCFTAYKCAGSQYTGICQILLLNHRHQREALLH